MEVIVLVGGFGTRLRPWTEERAKPLLPILDKTLLRILLKTRLGTRINGFKPMRCWPVQPETPKILFSKLTTNFSQQKQRHKKLMWVS